MKVPKSPPRQDVLLERLLSGDDPTRALRVLSAAWPDPDYLHWDDLRRRKPPEGFSVEEWWWALTMNRSRGARRLRTLTDTEGHPFWYSLPDVVLRLTDDITRMASGQISVSNQVTDPQTRDRYIVSSLMEEAITSSQLEGAVTTRVVAKQMLRSGRAPRDVSEQMIFNNYRAMQYIVTQRDEELTPELVLELHRLVTEGTLQNPEAAGRLQSADEERVALWDVVDEDVVHQPPPAEQLPDRLTRLCAFANARDAEPYLPPLLRALTLHFMMGYDHYFEDGNGRTARAVFYWSMLHEGFWLAEFLTISRILKQAPAQYGRSFLYTETDSGDLTYFFIYHLRVIRRAIDELHEHLRRKMDEMRSAQSRLRALPGEFNHRQIALLDHALRNPGFEYSVNSHMTSHNVVPQTARTDLNGLVEAGYLERVRRGRAHLWRPVSSLNAMLTSS